MKSFNFKQFKKKESCFYNGINDNKINDIYLLNKSNSKSKIDINKLI